MLKHKVAIYIPSTVAANKPADPALINKMLEWAKNKFASRFGGFTVTNVIGGYMSAEHGLIEESIAIVSSYCDEDGLTHVQAIREFAQIVAKTMSQECVSVEVDGTLELVAAE